MDESFPYPSMILAIVLYEVLGSFLRTRNQWLYLFRGGATVSGVKGNQLLLEKRTHSRSDIGGIHYYYPANVSYVGEDKIVPGTLKHGYWSRVWIRNTPKD
jgi:hypothetical protein